MGVSLGKKGALLIIFYHGFISPLMFWLVGLLAWWKTRSLIVVKMLSFSQVFLLMVFMVIIINIGFPPFIGFLREILMFKALVNVNLILMVMIWGVLLRCYYNIYLFWCFNAFVGMVFKLNFFRLDLFIFLIFVILLNI
jgi:formate hydrogenlyase subunit 3/multisubunit Na+/H+ antiporter MnhD subunit